jgi:hypothetical protein
MIIHQGIINTNDAMFPQGIIISVLGPNKMSITKILKDIMEDVGPGGDENIDQLLLDHIPDDLSHPPWNHGSGQSQEDNTAGVIEHLSENFVTFKDIPALERSILKAPDQIQQGLSLFQIQMSDGLSEEFGLTFFCHVLKGT